MFLSFVLLFSMGIGDVILVCLVVCVLISLEMFVGVMYLVGVVLWLIGLMLLCCELNLGCG